MSLPSGSLGERTVSVVLTLAILAVAIAFAWMSTLVDKPQRDMPMDSQ